MTPKPRKAPPKKPPKSIDKPVKSANPVGRPSLYKEEYCDTIVKYFDVAPISMTIKRELNKDGTIKSEVEIPVANTMPTLQRFAHTIGVHVDTMIEWCRVYPKFSEAYARAKQLQEDIWMTNSLLGLYNAQFAQFYGKNCLGYKDKVETESTNVNLNRDMSESEADEILKKYKDSV